jgi:PAS domain S-box-containing protein
VVIGRTDFDLVPLELAQAYADKDREVLGSRMPAEIGEEVIATRGGEPRVINTKKIPILDSSGDPLYLLGISQDITERRAALEGLRLARLEASAPAGLLRQGQPVAAGARGAD